MSVDSKAISSWSKLVPMGCGASARVQPRVDSHIEMERQSSLHSWTMAAVQGGPMPPERTTHERPFLSFSCIKIYAICLLPYCGYYKYSLFLFIIDPIIIHMLLQSYGYVYRSHQPRGTFVGSTITCSWWRRLPKAFTVRCQ